MNEQLLIVTGHYGSGKTEFAVNLALSLARAGQKTALADLDIVNPYFCSRERKALLEEAGVRVVLSNAGNADMPALNPAVLSLLEPGVLGVMDVGGDAAGARVLARFSHKIREIPYALYCIINFNRPETGDALRAQRYLREIEQGAKLKVTGLVNNTHLCLETSAADVMRGAALIEQVSRDTGIPVAYHAFMRKLSGEVSAASGELFPMDIHMKKPWEIEPMEDETTWLEK